MIETESPPFEDRPAVVLKLEPLYLIYWSLTTTNSQDALIIFSIIIFQLSASLSAFSPFSLCGLMCTLCSPFTA